MTVLKEFTIHWEDIQRASWAFKQANIIECGDFYPQCGKKVLNKFGGKMGHDLEGRGVLNKI